MRTRALGAAALALLLLPWPAAAQAAEPIGAAVRIVNRVTGSIDEQQRELAVGDPVNRNEAIEVAYNALGELRLADNTKLALGPGARLVLDRFVYDPAPSTGTISANLLRGAFRFITGLARKGDYRLRTPSASITVRGTIFDIYVDTDGGTWLLLLEGSVNICNTAGQCADVVNPCGVVHITPGGDVAGPEGWPAQQRRINFDTAFPFVGTPPSIDSRPLFTRTAVELGQCAPPPRIEQQRAEAPPSPPSSAPMPPPVPQRDDGTMQDDVPPQRERTRESYTPPPPPVYGSSSEPTEAPYVPPGNVILARNFSGAYVGANVGYGVSTSNSNVSCISPAGAFSVSPNCYQAIFSGAFVTGYDPSPRGLTGGLVAGYDFRFTNVVIGFVTDMSISGVSGSDMSATAVPTYVPEFGRAEQNVEWLGTLRSRLGFVTGNMLFYVTGGLAYAQVETSYELGLPAAFPAPVAASVSDRAWEVGWTAGVGGEISFGIFSLSAEYLFYDLGSRTVAAGATLGGVPQPTTYFPARFELDGHLIRIGTNFPLN